MMKNPGNNHFHPVQSKTNINTFFHFYPHELRLHKSQPQPSRVLNNWKIISVVRDFS